MPIGGKARNFKACGPGKEGRPDGAIRRKSGRFVLAAGSLQALREHVPGRYRPVMLLEEVRDRLLDQVLKAHLALGGQPFERLHRRGVDIHHLAHADLACCRPLYGLTRRALETTRARSSACAIGDLALLGATRRKAPFSKASITASWT